MSNFESDTFCRLKLESKFESEVAIQFLSPNKLSVKALQKNKAPKF